MSGGRRITSETGSANKATSNTSNVPSDVGVAISRMPGLVVPGPDGNLAPFRGLTGFRGSTVFRGLTGVGDADGDGEVDGVAGSDGSGEAAGLGRRRRAAVWPARRWWAGPGVNR